MNNLKIEVHSFKGLLDTYERAKNDSEEGRTIKNQFAKENSKKAIIEKLWEIIHQEV